MTNKGLRWERWGIVGTIKNGETAAVPRLLTSNCLSANEAQKQCKRYAEQGWGCQVLSLSVIAQPPNVPG